MSLAKIPHSFHSRNTQAQHSLQATLQQAVSLHQQGQLTQAEVLYKKVLQLQPNNFDALRLFGLIASQTSRLPLAADLMGRALAIKSTDLNDCFNYANTLQALGRHDEAIRYFQRALDINSAAFEIWNNLGNSQQVLQRYEDALASYERALQVAPDHPFLHKNRGDVLYQLHRNEEAMQSYAVALQLNPAHVGALNNMGAVLLKDRAYDAALNCFSQALSLKPDFLDALNNQGSALYKLRRYQEALASYDLALRCNPEFAEGYDNRADVLRDTGDQLAALDSYGEAIKLNPTPLTIRTKAALTLIPVLPYSAQQVEDSRNRFSSALSELKQWAYIGNGVGQEEATVEALLPFFLAYQERNNRLLLSEYGEFLYQLMTRWQARQSLPQSQTAPVAANRIRLGIVSTHICNQSVWNAIVKGWFQQLDKSRFEIHVFYLETRHDQETAFAQANATSFESGSKTTLEWMQSISAKALDILIYPEIGMEPACVKLALMRLAPVQIVTWGHPETSGLPTMDYYLSAEGFEQASSSECYTEKLISLPNLGCYYESADDPVAHVEMGSLGVNADVPVLICPGTPFKYQPEFDHALVEIARRMGEVQLVFFTYYRIPQLSQRLLDRLLLAFQAAGLSGEKYLKFIPWQSSPAFLSVLQQADVFLDTMGFSGFNTVMQAIACNLPIVAYQGKFMRGRLASAPLRRMGMDELIAENADDYIQLAVRLAQDKNLNRLMRAQIQARQHVLYKDESPIRAMEDCLVELYENEKVRKHAMM